MPMTSSVQTNASLDAIAMGSGRLPSAVSSFADSVMAPASNQNAASVGHNVVVKADGLCGGNGTYVCSSAKDAVKAIDTIMVDKAYGDAGNKVVIEKRIPGIEFSVFALYDEKTFVTLPMALDYKRADNGTGLFLVSAPAAEGYYPKIGMKSYLCWGLPRGG
jgi:phosphoribosylamine-glycine ligase